MNAKLDQTSIESIENSLKENFKLSSYEAKTYLALLKQGKQNPKQLSSTAEVPMPRIYDTLESLMTKGFAMRQSEFYIAISPEQALKGRSNQFELQFSQEQKQRRVAKEDLSKLLRLLVSNDAEESSRKSSGEISILKGFNSIANKFSELLENSSDIILIAKRAIEAKEVFIPILTEYSEVRKKKTGGRKSLGRRRVRIILPRDANITKEEASRARKANVEIRRSDYILFDMMITDLDDVIIGVPDPLSDEINHAIAIWVRNSSFSRSARDSVDDLWKSAKSL